MERIKSNIQDPFFRKANKPTAPKYEVNNTPIRQRDLHNKENANSNYNRNKDIPHTPIEAERDSVNPYINESAANMRTIPKKRVSIAGKGGCVNHLDAEAQFKIQIDGQSLTYCSKCAAHLASNGFKVQRVLSSRSPRRIKEVTRTPTNLKRRQQLSTFLQNLKELQAGYQEKGQYLVKVQQSHETEKQTIQNLYASLFQYLEYIKDEHLGFLDQEAKKSSQICEIQSEQIGQTLEELKAMRQDVEQNVQKIVQEVDENSYNECMAYYQQKQGIHEHRLSQLGADSHPANCTTSECIEQKLNEFKYFIDGFTGMLSSKSSSQAY